MPCSQLILLGRLTRPDKIAQGFRVLVRNPDCRQIVEAVIACQLQCIQPVRFDALAWLLRNKSWRNNRALNSSLSQLPIEYEARRAGFVTGPQLLNGTKLLDQLPDDGLPTTRQQPAKDLHRSFDWCRLRLKATRLYLLLRILLWGVIEAFAGSVWQAINERTYGSICKRGPPIQQGRARPAIADQDLTYSPGNTCSVWPGILPHMF